MRGKVMRIADAVPARIDMNHDFVKLELKVKQGVAYLFGDPVIFSCWQVFVGGAVQVGRNRERQCCLLSYALSRA